MKKIAFRQFPGLLALCVTLLTAALFASEAHSAINVTRTSSPVFYTHSGTGTATTSPMCNYLAFNASSTTAINDAWITISNFAGTGAYLSLGGGDGGVFHAGPMNAGQTVTAFFYVCSSYTGGGITAAQTYNVNTYSGNPTAGGTLQNTTGFSSTIDDSVIQASANQVNAIWADINPSVLGATTTLTVDGDTGTIGCVNPPSTCSGSSKGPLVFNPATFTDWRADAYELVGSSIVLSSGNSGTYNNTLYIDNVLSNSSTHYNAIYYFRPVATTASTTTLSPVNYIASGTQMKHTSLNSGAYASAGGLLPILPALNTVLMAKSVSTSTLPAQGGTVTYTLSATNNGSYSLSLDSFVDVLPGGATYVPGSTTFNNASFADPYISGSTLYWASTFTIPAGSTGTLIFQATLPATPGTYTNSATARIGNAVIDTTLSTSDNAPPTATTVVLQAPTISKSFAPNALAINTASLMTLTISNPNSAQSLNGIAVSDTLPGGLVFASPPNAVTTCTGASLNLTGSLIAISGGTLAAGQNCSVTVNVTSASNAVYTNTTGTVSSSNGGTGTAASATITFSPKPAITKSFSVPTIPRDGTATLTFTITNNTAAAITGMTFDDLFPAGLVTANPPVLSPASPCGGTLNSWNGSTAGALSSSGGDLGIRLTGGGISSPGGTCTFNINVTSATAGIYANTAGGVNSNESSPAGPASNTASLVVMSGPTVSKSFSPSNIGKGQASTLTITLSNPNTVAITGAAFTDIYPANVTTAPTPNASTSCTSGTVGSTSGSVSLSGAMIPANGSCTVSIAVTSNLVNLVPGYVNTIGVGAVTTSNAGSNTAAASATLIVSSPSIDKSFTFNPATGTATMSFTITNNDVGTTSNLSFADLFPANMKTANPPVLTPATNPCGTGSSVQSWNGSSSGTLTPTGGDPGIQLTSGQLAAGASCTFSINMSVDALGVYYNQTSNSTGSFGTGSASNVATWISPSVSKVFSPKTVGPGDTSRMSITITNPSFTTTLTGLAISDTYPTTASKVAGGSLAAAITSPTPNATNSCGGTMTATTTGISLSGGTLAPGASCTIAADVLATNTTPAIYVNTTGRVASNQGIGVSGSDTLLVTASPTITKSFTGPVTLSGGTANSTMSITIKNNSGTNITSVSLSDTLPGSPAQMRWVNTVSNGCGGTLTDTADAALVSGISSGIKLAGGAITSGGSCTIQVTVSVPAPGSYSNTTTGATSSANTVVGPVSNTAILRAYLSAPTVTKTFATSGFQVNGTDRITITLTNPNTTAITGAAFTDTYPTNMINAASPNVANTCGGTATAAAGASTFSLSGGTIPASGSCTVQVDVTATAADSYTNTLAVNSVTSTNATPGPSSVATANATAYLPPALIKTFGSATINSGGSTSLNLTLSNPAGNPATLANVQVDDTFPPGLTLLNTAFTYSPAACGTVTRTTGAASVAGDNNVRFSAASLAAGVSCQVSINVTSSTIGTVTNTTNVPTATGPAALTGVTAWANLAVLNTPSLMVLKTAQVLNDPVNLAVNPKAIPGAEILYTIIVTNSGPGTVDSNTSVITDPIPANMSLRVCTDPPACANTTPPITFSCSVAPAACGLTYNYATDVTYSNTVGGGAPFTYIPVPDANGYDAAVTGVRINPQGIMNGNGGGNTSFNLYLKMKIK